MKFDKLSEPLKRMVRVRTAPSRTPGRMADGRFNDQQKGGPTLMPAQQSRGEDLRKLFKVQEAERRRIARELHDEFGQHLTGLKFDLTWLRSNLGQRPRAVNPASLIKKTEAMIAAVEALMVSIRQTATSLHPSMLDDLGLLPAVECLAKEFQTRTGIQCSTLIDPALGDLKITLDSSTALYRIVQEFLTNVVRHAQASAVNITLFERTEELVLELVDNGKGIDRHQMKQRGSLGLRGMCDRVAMLDGTVAIVGEPGHGTTISITLPFAALIEGKAGSLDEHPHAVRTSH